MIRFIAAIDTKQGLADDHGIPWAGNVPTDVKYYRDHTIHEDVLMGLGTYKELSKLWSDKRNFVATRANETLRDGFIPVTDARKLLQNATSDIWVLGGAGLFSSTLDLADELYITQLNQDFHCTKFFPLFKDKFTLESESEPITENGITYTFQVWVRQDRVKQDI